ncbi:formyltetrahydrofolate deformylase [Virgibacillus pantothenticus]|uniref:Formyltetrahydrofolate deformylase n=1 Tax=Virgibacillus pantothenticus TaxID=1473 RepID=A0A0L0QN72_VIRPA|nr:MULTISPECIES: formyltetrahydrofolate deformylase [Virgibacillus]API93384.1 formyltetrahydrofolate deformylase [Virgibacillus sp. 6R]KNE19703.1 formyltetrahydrofolate deformylase [Virgibacillus pantothenticus]MBS7428555.1 formyltetrahydrofolate deformylase [Virgibacillus sp. 19R1-5]MBU8567628.1 formyltetrahydrofolate deformylase [Virgibacillus pantothenticus]MBU8601416.1 formyltetrahydrofolate deformylase [Virgibacillus pantothenticus]
MNHYMKKSIQQYQAENKNKARLLIKCPDQPGIVAAVSDFLYRHDANIITSDQYTLDPDGGQFFMRVEFYCPQLLEKAEVLEEAFQSIGEKFAMEWQLLYVSQLKNMAIFVSNEPHCLMELLWEYQSGDLMAHIALVISNHETARETVESLGIPFYYIPANKDIRKQVEEKQLQLLNEHQVDVIVLARYMQILTSDFVKNYEHQIINIHHSFLPAFVGAKPYERAYKRGVKMIGATSHYVTNDLDEGPIIEQDIGRVDHRDNSAKMKKIGQAIERVVLSRAVKWHLEDRIIVHENKTIVF